MLEMKQCALRVWAHKFFFVWFLLRYKIGVTNSTAPLIFLRHSNLSNFSPAISRPLCTPIMTDKFDILTVFSARYKPLCQWAVDSTATLHLLFQVVFVCLRRSLSFSTVAKILQWDIVIQQQKWNFWACIKSDVRVLINGRTVSYNSLVPFMTVFRVLKHSPLQTNSWLS